MLAADTVDRGALVFAGRGVDDPTVVIDGVALRVDTGDAAYRFDRR